MLSAFRKSVILLPANLETLVFLKCKYFKNSGSFLKTAPNFYLYIIMIFINY